VSQPSRPPSSSGRLPWLAQAGLVAATALITLLPPARGPMLLIPIAPARLADSVAVARQGDARLIAAGPLPASLIVEGSRDTLAMPALAHGMILIAGMGACDSSNRIIADRDRR